MSAEGAFAASAAACGVSPAGSVVASAYGRGCHRQPATHREKRYVL